MKAIIFLALIACSVTTKALTPRVRLPAHFDSSLMNTLQTTVYPQQVISKFALRHFASRRLPMTDSSQIVAFVSAVVPWISDAAKQGLVSDLKDLQSLLEGTHCHLVYENQRSVMVNLIRDGSDVFVQVSTINGKHGLFKSKTNYHQRTISKIGMAFDELKQISGDLKPFEIKKAAMLRKLYLSAIKESRGNNAYGMRMLGIGVMDAISSVVNAWGAIAQNFKSSFKTTFVGITRGKGFSKFKSDTVAFVNQGIRKSRWDFYCDQYVVLTGTDANSEIEKKTRAWLSLAELVPSVDLFQVDNIFDIKKDGETASLVAFSNHDMVADKVNIVSAMTKGAFKLSPDVYIYEKSKSIAGGIYQEVKEKREYKERSLREEDIKALTAFATINAANRLSEVFNIKFELPTDKPEELFKN